MSFLGENTLSREASVSEDDANGAEAVDPIQENNEEAVQELKTCLMALER